MGVMNEAAIERAVKAQTDVLRDVLAELRAIREAVGGVSPEPPPAETAESARRRFARR